MNKKLDDVEIWLRYRPTAWEYLKQFSFKCLGVFFITLRQRNKLFKKKYYHSEFVYDGYAYSSIAEKFIDDMGVKRNGVRKCKVEQLNKDEYDVLVVRKVDIAYALDYFEKHKHDRYDWKAIFLTQFINVNIESKNAKFCADINAGMLKQKDSHMIGIIGLINLVDILNSRVEDLLDEDTN